MKSYVYYTICALLSAPLISTMADDTPGQPKASQDELSVEARAIAEELRSSLPADSEAIAMLNDILEGSHLSAEDGWFPLAKAQSSYDWHYVLTKYDQDKDGTVTVEELNVSQDDFGRLDRDGDKALTDGDLVYKEHSLAASPSLQMFFMGDKDANGKLTRDEFAGMFEMFADEGSEYLALDELRDQLAPAPPGARDKRADRPSRSTLVQALKTQEIGSLQSGPKVGEQAPNFTLQDLQGNEVTLSNEIGDKPIVLIFGNFTCGPFRSQAGNIERLVQRYEGRAKFFLVYVREAHPKDGWWMLSNQRAGIELPQPTTFDERKAAATTCRNHLELSIPMLVDTLDDTVGSTYSGMPNRLYVINRDGRIVFKNGRGPFGFHPRQLEQALILLLNE